MNQSHSLRIAIIGGGPAGLTLARVLWTRGVTASVFEQEASPNERSQGGSLDLHLGTGQLAVARAGLEAEFQAVARYEDQGFRRMNKQGVVLSDQPQGLTEGGTRPEVDRTDLRRILLESLPAGTVRWGHKLRALESRPDGTHALTFTQGHTECFDLVVGADGTWSKVRPHLSSAEPQYTGVTYVSLDMDDVDTRHPEAARLVGRGTLMAFAKSRGLVAQRNGHGRMRIYAVMRVPPGWAESGAIDITHPDQTRADLLKLYSDWASPLLTLIRECGDTMVSRPLYALPVGHRWEHRRGLTLLGDAAHVMSPFGAQGVNLAMLDASDLALALTGTGDWDAAVREHERVLCARAEESARFAAEGVATVMTSDEAVVEHLLSTGDAPAAAQPRA